MELRVVVLIFGFISLTFAQEDFVGDIKFSFREDKVPTIINHLLNNSLETQSISTLDIIRLSKLDLYDLDQAQSVLNALNISIEEAFNVDNLEIALKTLNISFRDFLRDWNNITNTTLTPPILEALNISSTNFFMTYTIKIEDIYNVLRDGIYDKTHIDAALVASGKTSTEIYTATRDLFANYVTSIPSSQFMDILKNNGWKARTTMDLFKAANITLRDIYNVDKFKNIFTEVINNLNANLSVAVFVAPDQVTVHKAAYNKIKNQIDGYTIKPTVLGLEVELYKVVPLGPQIVGLKTKQATTDFIPIVENYNTTNNNCSYIIISNGQVSSILTKAENLKIIKTNQTIFQFGSPLICDGYLYGLARSEDSDNIEFDRFYEKDEPIDYDSEFEEPDDDDSGANGIFSFTYFIIIVQLILCHILF